MNREPKSPSKTKTKNSKLRSFFGIEKKNVKDSPPPNALYNSQPNSNPIGVPITNLYPSINSSAKTSTYQPLNVPTYQPANNSNYQQLKVQTYQPINPSPYQPANPLSYQPLNPSTYQPLSQSTYQPLNLSTHQPTNQSTYQPVKISTHQVLQPFTHNSIIQSTYKPLSQTTYQPINPSTYQPINPSTYQPINISLYRRSRSISDPYISQISSNDSLLEVPRLSFIGYKSEPEALTRSEYYPPEINFKRKVSLIDNSLSQFKLSGIGSKHSDCGSPPFSVVVLPRRSNNNPYNL